jgi:hypothetical protein
MGQKEEIFFMSYLVLLIDYVELEGVLIDLELERHDPSLLGAG